MNPRTYHRKSRLAWPRTVEYAASIEVGSRSILWHLIRLLKGVL